MSLHIRHSHPVCSSKAQCIVCQVDNVLLATRYFNSSQAYCGLLGLTQPFVVVTEEEPLLLGCLKMVSSAVLGLLFEVH